MPTPPTAATLDIDEKAFERDLLALRAEVVASLGPRDLEHVKKLERWGRTCTALGYATAWIAPNPVSAFLISQGNTTRWTVMMHHVGHRGLDAVPGVPERLTSKRFAVGARRLVDWLDWVAPDAWRHEHNVLHHYHTGEIEDPDLVEEQARSIRESDLPLAVKYAAVAFYAATWKLTYYAPTTLAALRRSRKRTAGAQGAGPAQATQEPVVAEKHLSYFDPRRPEGRELWWRCVLPYGLVRFAAIPALFLPLGPVAVANVWINSVGAEVMTNLHTFLVIVPNHAGSDLYRYEGRARSRAEFFVRQVLGSTNFATGGDVNDMLHGFLNYQIEHHLFPDLPPLRYQELQPKVKALCAKHGVPYVQESVFTRARKLVDIMVGKTSMKRLARDPRPRVDRPADEAAPPGDEAEPATATGPGLLRRPETA